ncbi:Zn-ribbon domain-containing OB-fold protein [Methanobacterium alkalithermotolerans]|uniref:Zn-ribbon domain-containing OB-fold protein n=1 Tax=Methanobacterium alkalithermotolerans TaxID=2731220 RepID=A0A8T8K779_9EURY|nr:Zn-ribbon domain-containing OB-fold protein [Methanobacterium alkalithermotolerans]QUH23385.1 Zn-ribbon domain-containing OB-fold protein [Methanobacterium alkalithermotolerans]RJS49908.1 MAG: transcriptional regulator [Methanobacterium sp.]
MTETVRTWRHIPQRYNLIGSKCLQCNKVFFPLRIVCPECRRKGKLENIKLSGKGKVYSYSVINTPTDEFKEIAPYAVAIVELDEGAKVTTQIVDCGPEDIQIGDEVEMVFRKIREQGDDGVISYGFKFKLKK